jgi:hypothetical protein
LIPIRRHLLRLMIAVAIASTVLPAFALTAADARSLSFKLQSEGMRLYREGKFREATQVFQQVVNINLNSFLAFYYLGLSLSAERRPGEAIEPPRPPSTCSRLRRPTWRWATPT